MRSGNPFVNSNNIETPHDHKRFVVAGDRKNGGKIVKTFGSWLSDFRGNQTPIGDLANAVPIATKTTSEALLLLPVSQAGALFEASNRYRQYLRSSPVFDEIGPAQKNRKLESNPIVGEENYAK
jgi:hypothetical protein